VRPHIGPVVANLDRSDALYYTTNWASGGTLQTVFTTPWLQRRIPLERHGGKLENGVWVRGRINVTFADGHGETVQIGDFGRVRISPYRFPNE
jgi:prepilin-type processing-associated H-X9-DG protein